MNLGNRKSNCSLSTKHRIVWETPSGDKGFKPFKEWAYLLVARSRNTIVILHKHYFSKGMLLHAEARVQFFLTSENG
jgi:hypothetical protein